MTAFFSQIVAFFMSLLTFFGSLGLFGNQPVTVHVTDADGNPVSGIYVYYEDYRNETYGFLDIGVTDENGDVAWEEPGYGRQEIGLDWDDITKTDKILPDYSVKVDITPYGGRTVTVIYTDAAAEAMLQGA